jgi:ubiquinone/menaquinone biosynthesis C-methylase UbiE
MKLLEKIYYFFRDLSSRSEERGERSAGFLQNKIRKSALAISVDYCGRLLEVGCGEGLFLTQLVKINSKVEAWGVDNWPQILARARERFIKNGLTEIKLVEAQAGQLPFEDAYFDAVIFVNVLICIVSLEEVKAAIKEISRVTKPGAKLILEFRNKRNILLKVKYKLAKFYDATVKNHPLSTYYEKDILGLLRENGFEVRKRRYVGYFIKGLAPVIIIEAQKHV